MFSNNASSSSDNDQSSWLRDSGWGSSTSGWSDEQPAAAHQQAATTAADSFASSWGWSEEPKTRSTEDNDEEMVDASPGSPPAAAAGSSSGSTWKASSKQLSVFTARAQSRQPKFKPLMRVSKAEASSTNSALAHSRLPAPRAAAAAAASVPPLLRPIRFVKSKQLLEPDMMEIDKPGTAAEPPALLKSGGRVSLLARVAPAASASAAATKSSKPPTALRDAPSLLTVKKTSANSHPNAAPSFPSSTATSSTNTLTLACIFSSSYRMAGRKKQKHRDGFLHLFKSTLTAASTAAPTKEAKAVASAVGTAVTFLKSHLYSERGVLLDEQIGHCVMQAEPPPVAPKGGRRNDGAFEESLWGTPAASSGSKKKRGWCGDEVESDGDSSDSDDGAASNQPWPPSKPSNSSLSSIEQGKSVPRPNTELVNNIFAPGESVLLGRYECALEEEISKVEYDKKTKIITGQLTNAPLSRFASSRSCTIVGPPIPADNKGFALLAQHCGGVPDKPREPIGLTWRNKESSNYGIGFKEPLKPPPGSMQRREHGRERGQLREF